MITREEFDKQHNAITENANKKYHDFMIKNLLAEYSISLEQQNKDLMQQVKEWKMALYLAEQQNTALQARITELEEKDKLKNCEECYDKVSLVFKMRGIE